MEVSMRSRPRIEWLALWAIAVLLAAPCCVCQNRTVTVLYAVGGDWGTPFNWRRQASSLSYYQDWADRQTVYVNDSLYFSYNSSLYDVLIINPDRASWANCSIDFNDVQGYYSSEGSARVYFPSPGKYLFMSSGLAVSGTSQDCLNGMKFEMTVSDLDRPSDSPPPPPPAAPPPPPQTPANSRSPPMADTPPHPPSEAQPPPPPEAVLPGGGVRDINVELEWSRQLVGNHYEMEILKKYGKVLAVNSTLEFFFKDGFNVREVDQSEYDSCTATTTRPRFLNTRSPALVQLTEKRTYYFIDSLANGDNCRVGNMKLSVQVGDPEQDSTPVAGQKKTTFPVAAVVVPSVIILVVALASPGFLYYRRQYGPKPRGRYQERNVVTSDTFRPSTA